MEAQTDAKKTALAANLRGAAIRGIEMAGQRPHEGAVLSAYRVDFQGTLITLLAGDTAHEQGLDGNCALFAGGLLEGGFKVWAKAAGVDGDGRPVYLTVDPEPESPKATILDSVYDFVNTLTADDVGIAVVDGFTVRFEGFTDLCLADAEARTKLAATDPRHLASADLAYEEVEQDWHKAEGCDPIESGMAGSEENPIMWSIWRVQPNAV